MHVRKRLSILATTHTASLLAAFLKISLLDAAQLWSCLSRTNRMAVTRITLSRGHPRNLLHLPILPRPLHLFTSSRPSRLPISHTSSLSMLQGHSLRGRALMPLSLLNAVIDLAGLDEPRARELCELGAVYLGKEIKVRRHEAEAKSCTCSVAQGGLVAMRADSH